MYPRHRLDIDSRTLLTGVLGSVWPRDRSELEQSVKKAFPHPGELLVCFSVRSGFELLLEALALPEGSEAVVSAVTHPDMVKLLAWHGVRAVPVDLDVDTLEPDVDLVADAIGPETRLLVVAHLFGTRARLDELASLAHSTGVLLVEDCAQSFRGPGADSDSPADVSMFSFGTIKTSTALGGAVLRIRNARLRTRMERLQSGWPTQSRSEYLARAARCLVLNTLSQPAIYELLFRGSALLGADLDSAIRSGVRGFAASGRKSEYLRAFRRRPSNVLLAVLARRVSSFDIARFERRVLLGERLQRSLPDTVAHPGDSAEIRTHWLFPLIAPDAGTLRANLAAAGFDATPATSAIGVVHAPSECRELEPREASRMMKRLLFVPLYPEMTELAVDRIAGVIAETDQGGMGAAPSLVGAPGGMTR